jgi:enhancing lycopene biosynthesis protein 2
MTIGVLLSGCGVYDGAEIQEAVLTLLAIEEIGAKALCISVDAPQHHVVNHLTGDEMPESRNMMVEAARIARGEVKNINDVNPIDMDGLVIPGGFGSVKNFTKWAFEGPEGDILPEVKLLLVNLVNVGKPIAPLCVSPIVLAKALEGSIYNPSMTIGTDAEPTPYDIDGFMAGLEKIGATVEKKSIREIHVDKKNHIITAPCYMQKTTILDVRKNIRSAVEAMRDMV